MGAAAGTGAGEAMAKVARMEAKRTFENCILKV